MRLSALVASARLARVAAVGFGVAGLAGDAPPLWPPPVGIAPERVEAHYEVDRPWPTSVATPLGTVVNKPGAAPGCTLVTPGASGTHLIDNAGRVVHHWEHTLANARMLPNGNVLLLATQRRSAEEVIAAGANPAFVDAEGIVSFSRSSSRPAMRSVTSPRCDRDRGASLAWALRLGQPWRISVARALLAGALVQDVTDA